MATNSSDNPATDGQDTITGTLDQDTLTGALGDDQIDGGVGDDLLHGDRAVAGAWHFETYDRNFSSASGQAFDIESGTRTGSGYVTDFNESDLTNSVRGTTGNPEDFGVIYTSTLVVAAGGDYTFSTTSDDGSTIQIFDENGNPVSFDNQTGGTLDYLNNDFHQGSTTRSGVATLDPNTTYTIQIRYWENGGGDNLSATVSGPDTGGATEDLLTSSMLGDPPPPDYSVTGVPAGVEGADTIYGGAGDDTIFGDGGDDVLYGDSSGSASTGGAWAYEYYDLPTGTYANLADAGFTQNGGRDNTNAPSVVGTTNSFDPSGYDTGDDFALKFTSDLEVNTGGTYTFTTSSDDGSRLFVNGVEVVANDGLHSTTTRSGSIALGAGTHTIEIVYFENTGSQTLSGTVRGPDTGNSSVDLATYPDLTTPDTAPAVVGDDVIDGGDGDDEIFGEAGNDNLTGGLGDDTLAGGVGADQMTGGAGDDTFIYAAGDGADAITDFNVGNSGVLDDGDQSNNDFIDLSGFYNASSLAAVNGAGGTFASELGLLRADAEDGVLDGVIDGTDYSALIADINLILEDGAGGAITGAALTFDNTNVPCFCAGTLVDTPLGPRPVETLEPGDLVLTVDHGAQPLVLGLHSAIGQTALVNCETLRPVRISAGALGRGLPKRDLLVSRQHRMLVHSPIAARMFGTQEVLLAAIHLVGLPGVTIAPPRSDITYVHLVFSDHQVVFAEGAPSESFYPGPEALKGLSAAARAEFTRIFPAAAVAQPWKHARPIPIGKRQRRLVARLRQNEKHALDGPLERVG